MWRCLSRRPVKHLVFSPTEVSLGKVDQNPSEVIQDLGQSETIQCSHDISNYNVILWYKNTEKRSLQLLGYITVTKGNTEPGFNDKIQLDGDATTNKKASVTLKNLTSDDTGVYFCAASLHSSTTTPHCCTKTHMCCQLKT